MLNFIRGFLNFFAYPPIIPSPYKQLKDVKVGDEIRIEWTRIVGDIGKLKCMGNDPKTKKILLEGNLVDGGTELFIFNYNSYQFKNFNLLNQIPNDSSNNADITALKQQIDKAIENEEYELARTLQNKIDKLLNK